MILHSTRRFSAGCSPRRCAARRCRRSRRMPDNASLRRAPRPARGAIEAYIRARRAYEDEASAYWQSVVDKRRGATPSAATAKPIVLDDYVLTQPPVYTGPPRPPGYMPPRRDPAQPPLPIPGIADFLKAAAEQYSFVPDRPKTERNSSRPTPRWRRPPASPASRRSASMPSRPAATAPMTDRPASSATARTRGRSRRRWATTSCSAPTRVEPARRARRQVRRGA